MVRKLVSQPGGFMERKVGQPNIRWEVVTVLVIGALGAAGLAYVGDQITRASGADYVVFPVIGTALEPIIGAFVLWVGYSVALHLI
jgi:hypothetical protein